MWKNKVVWKFSYSVLLLVCSVVYLYTYTIFCSFFSISILRVFQHCSVRHYRFCLLFRLVFVETTCTLFVCVDGIFVVIASQHDSFTYFHCQSACRIHIFENSNGCHFFYLYSPKYYTQLHYTKKGHKKNLNFCNLEEMANWRQETIAFHSHRIQFNLHEKNQNEMRKKRKLLK